MPINPNDLEAALELLESRTVRTDRGTYIKVDDLRELVQEFKDHEKEEREAPQFRSFAAASAAAKEDPELKAAFDESTRPPVGVHVKPEGMVTP